VPGRVFVRAQSVIRADGAPSAQAPALQLVISDELDALTLRAIARQPRFPRGCWRIRAENAVIDKTRTVREFIYSITDCAQMCFSSLRN